MWTIRKEQTEAFEQSALKRFEERMLTHLRKFLADSVASAGETKAREMIRYGIARSSTYGMIAERDVCLYIDLMFVFGPDFDRDKRLPWASAILRSSALRESSQRMDKLHGAATAFLRGATLNGD
jgi:hypothetical protein